MHVGDVVGVDVATQIAANGDIENEESWLVEGPVVVVAIVIVILWLGGLGESEADNAIDADDQAIFEPVQLKVLKFAANIVDLLATALWVVCRCAT